MAEREYITAGRLTERQLLGIDCARCGAYLGAHGLPLGQVEDRGYLLRLFGCDPPCAPPPLPRRGPGRSWRAAWGTDPQAPARPVPHMPAPEPSVRSAGAPPWRGTLLDRLPRWTATPSFPGLPPESFDDDTTTVERVAAGLRALDDPPPGG